MTGRSCRSAVQELADRLSQAAPNSSSASVSSTRQCLRAKPPRAEVLVNSLPTAATRGHSQHALRSESAAELGRGRVEPRVGRHSITRAVRLKVAGLPAGHQALNRLSRAVSGPLGTHATPLVRAPSTRARQPFAFPQDGSCTRRRSSVETRACSGVDRVFPLQRLTRKRVSMALQQEIDALHNRQTLAARALYREQMAMSVASPGSAEAAFKAAILAFADEPSPQNAGRYLAASERLTAIGRELGTPGASRIDSRAVILPGAA
jgi:hypothetical protein